MNRFSLLMLVIVTVLLFTGCANKAGDAAKQFTAAVEKTDFANMKHFASSASLEVVAAAETVWDQMDVAQKDEFQAKKYTLVSAKIDGEEATATFDEVNSKDRTNKVSRDLKLVKENGEWKVVIDSESESILPGS